MELDPEVTVVTCVGIVRLELDRLELDGPELDGLELDPIIIVRLDGLVHDPNVNVVPGLELDRPELDPEVTVVKLDALELDRLELNEPELCGLELDPKVIVELDGLVPDPDVNVVPGMELDRLELDTKVRVMPELELDEPKPVLSVLTGVELEELNGVELVPDEADNWVLDGLLDVPIVD